MNLEESNRFVEQMEKNNKNKRIVLAILVICAVLILILFFAMSFIKAQDDNKLKFFVNGKEVPITSTLLLQDETTAYMNVRELAELLNYSYQKGEYKNYTEDANSCYLKTPYEIISMTADSETITKYIINKELASAKDATASKELVIQDAKTGQQSLNIRVDSENETKQIFNIENPIKYINNELYVSFEELPRIFSVQLNTSQANRIRINSVQNFAVSGVQIAKNLGYSEVSNIYENLTAIVDNMLVIGDGTNYGVVSLSDGHEIISLKYENIIYKQNTKEFFVTAEGSVGIIASDGTTIIKPTEYDEITDFDELYKLFLVKKDEKYGVVNHEGEAIVYAEYDSIGLTNEKEFSNEGIRSFNLLFENSIPVNNNGKVGIVDINGEERLKCVYDSLGYVKNSGVSANTQQTNKTNTTQTNTAIVEDYDNVLIIPESLGIQGIVVNLNGLYGIYDAHTQRLIIPCACTKIYSRTKAGVTNYYLEYNEQEIELGFYLESNNLKTQDLIDKVSQPDPNKYIVENENIVEE